MAVVDIIQLLKSEGGEKFYPVTHKNAVIGLNDFFEAVPDETGGISVKLKSEYTGLWAEGWGSFGGVGVGGGGSSTSYLNDLLDVSAPSPSSGDLLVWDANHRDGNNNLSPSWVNVPQSSITPDLSGYGHSLSLSSAATFLLDSNGNYLLDSNGNYLVTSVSSTSINLLNGSGTIISSVTLPTQSVSSLSMTIGSATISLGGSATLTQIGVPAWAQTETLQGYVPDTRTVNGHALSSDVTVSKADVGLGDVENTALSTWAGTSNITTVGTITTGTWHGHKIEFSYLEDLYVGKTPVKGNNNSNDTLIGINGFTTASSASASGDSSLVVWENSAWHFKGNLYVDGWLASGGVGENGGSSSGTLEGLTDVSLSSQQPNEVLKYNGTHWVNTALKTIGGESILGSGNISVGGTYTLPSASASALGGIMVYSVITTPSINTPSTTAGKYYYVQCDSNGLAFVNVPWVAGSSGGGTLAEVGLTMPNCFSVSPSTLTSDGAFTVSFVSQTKNTVLAAPSSANGTPSFRALVAGDIPDLSSTYLTSHQSVTLATGTNSGTVKLTTAAGTTDNIAVKNCVTTDGTQTISGTKTFTATTTAADIVPGGTNDLGTSSSRWANIYGSNANLSGDLSMAQASTITIGPITISYDSVNKALHISGTDNGTAIGLYCDGWFASGGLQASS